MTMWNYTLATGVAKALINWGFIPEQSRRMSHAKALQLLADFAHMSVDDLKATHVFHYAMGLQNARASDTVRRIAMSSGAWI